MAELIEKKSLLNQADEIIHGARKDKYGNPLDNMTDIATMWSVILKCSITAEQVALCMAALKICREVHEHQDDNIRDSAGYVGLIEMIREERDRRTETFNNVAASTGTIAPVGGRDFYLDSTARIRLTPPINKIDDPLLHKV